MEKYIFIDSLISGLDILTKDQIKIIGNNLEQCVGAKKTSNFSEWKRSDLLHYLLELRDDIEIRSAELFLFLGLFIGVRDMADVCKNK